jgi:hypothetical protein
MQSRHPRTGGSPPLYATGQYQADYEGGEEYSYLPFVGRNGDGIYARMDLPALGNDFQVPIYLLQGEQDLLTSITISRPWFDGLNAPYKACIVLPRTNHAPDQIMVDAQYRVLSETSHRLRDSTGQKDAGDALAPAARRCEASPALAASGWPTPGR